MLVAGLDVGRSDGLSKQAGLRNVAQACNKLVAELTRSLLQEVYPCVFLVPTLQARPFVRAKICGGCISVTTPMAR